MTPEQLEIVKDAINTLGVPLCILVFIGLLIWGMRDKIEDFIAASSEQKRASIQRQAELNEMHRHSTAVIENNTAVLELIKADHGMIGRQLEQHEDMSNERMTAIKDRADEIDGKLNKVITDIEVVKNTMPKTVCRHHD